ncbi:unnamed protein product [Darwinula stevensoni]|uniref:Ig-like domain-containing protein n=1 Tax=Darwinula stevensoni TaxID=69355 RepID=A0A7R8X196_9CRUS|nr:unnamed protein product [Darwinula stevensoni]CAG0880011.1 unnamed protein product [Darwinula stevensoni]
MMKTSTGFREGLYVDNRKILCPLQPMSCFTSSLWWNPTFVHDKDGRHFQDNRGQPVYKGWPKSGQIGEGEELVITCWVNRFETIKWTKDKEDVSVTDTNYVINLRYDQVLGQAGTLTIVSARLNDTGEYKCNSLHKDGFKVSVFSDATILTNEDAGGGKILHIGKDLLLECNTTDDTMRPFRWYKEGEQILNDNKKIVKNNTLLIKSAQKGDSGTYRCVIDDSHNGWGNREDGQNITVYIPVDVEPFHGKSINLVQGDRLHLECRVHGHPEFTITWHKDGKLLEDDGRITLTNNNTTLDISDLQFEDRAVYMCLAKNVRGSDNSTILVRVKDKLAALWPFLGICAEVILLSTIIFFYERKRSKQEGDESEGPETANPM